MPQDISSILENVRISVETTGKSGRDSVYLDNVSFRVNANKLDVPYGSSLMLAENDVDWFFESAGDDVWESPPPPEESWWVDTFGAAAEPYGSSWWLNRLYSYLTTPGYERRAVLLNPDGSCVVCYQFQPVDHRVGGVHLDMTVTMRSSDVTNCLPQDVLMSQLILRRIANEVEMTPGWITFNIANAHVKWDDLEIQEEFDIDMPL